MSRTRFIVVPLVTLILIGLLIMGGFAIHRIGWTEGYRVGQLAAGGETGAVMPYTAYSFGTPGLLLTVGVILLLLVVVGKIFRFWAWKMAWGPWMMHAHGPWRAAYGPKSEDWAGHWHRLRHPMPPWYWEWEEQPGEKAEEAEPGSQAAGAEAEA